MIYLIGGPPRCGKTTLAEALSRKISIPYFALDHMTSMISPYIQEGEYLTKLPLRAARCETNYSNDIFYDRYSPEDIFGFYTRQAETYWPGVKNFVSYAIDDNLDLILEGWQILPHLLNSVLTDDNIGRLKVLFLYKIDIGDIASGLKASTASNDWALRNTKEEKTFSAIAKMISRFGAYVDSEANKYNYPRKNTDLYFTQIIMDSLEFLSA
jgi:2-phosphoglycerate kinase